MTKNIMIVGVGGQGTVLASRVIAQTAMEAGQFARTAGTVLVIAIWLDNRKGQ